MNQFCLVPRWSLSIGGDEGRSRLVFTGRSRRRLPLLHLGEITAGHRLCNFLPISYQTKTYQAVPLCNFLVQAPSDLDSKGGRTAFSCDFGVRCSAA